MTARVLGPVLAVVVLVASGAYFVVDHLYRWQWNRAVVSGIFFVAAEIALVAYVVLRRLSALEERLDELKERPAAAPPPAALEAISATAPPPKDRFSWLSSSRTNVFLPILLGAGVLLSGVAHVVERIAGATARPVLEHRLALRLQPLALPAGGLLGPAAPGRAAPRRRGTGVGRTLALVVTALLFWGAIDVISDATQTRGDPHISETTTALVLSISSREAGRDAEGTTMDLFETCRARFQRTLEVRELDLLGGNRVGLQVQARPGLGEEAQWQFRGCLEDATLARVQAKVLSLTTRRS